MVLGPEKAQQVVREEGLAVYMIVKEGEGFKTDVAAVPHFPCRREKLKSKIAGFLLRALPQTEGTLTAGDPS